MSSYFDAAIWKISELQQRGSDAERRQAIALVKQAVDRYTRYLDWVDSRLRTPDLEHLRPFKERMAVFAEHAKDLAKVPPHETWTVALEIIDDLHELAHRVGGARLMKRDGAPVMDNPYWDGHNDKP